MRIAVISDVHGNAFALEKVLVDVHSESPDLILNLGDQVYGRANPARAFEMQHSLGAVEILGNCELLLEGEDALAQWIQAELPSGALEHLRSLPITASVLEGEILACHGDLTNPNSHLFWSWQRGPYRTDTISELRRKLEGVSARVVLCGHTHREGMTALGDQLIVNAGAVSAQIDGDPRARWTLLERRKGRWTVEFRRVVYDWTAAANWALEHAPDAPEEAAYLLEG